MFAALALMLMVAKNKRKKGLNTAASQLCSCHLRRKLRSISSSHWGVPSSEGCGFDGYKVRKKYMMLPHPCKGLLRESLEPDCAWKMPRNVSPFSLGFPVSLSLGLSLSLSVPLCDFVSFLQVFSVTGPDSLDTPFHMFFTSHFDSQPRFYVIPFATLHILDLVKVTRHGTWSNNQTTWLNAHNAESRSRTLERRQSLSFEKHEPTSICVRSHISSL